MPRHIKPAIDLPIWGPPFWMRGVVAGVGLFAALIAALLFWFAWVEHQEAAALRDHGTLAQGKFLRTEESTSQGSGSSRSITYYYGIWSYRVNDHRFEMQDRGSHYQDVTDTVARLGPLARNQIIYLPEDPSVARLRPQIGPDLFGLLAGGGFFLFLGGIFVAAEVFLLKPGKPSRPT